MLEMRIVDKTAQKCYNFLDLKGFAYVGEIRTVEERDAKLLPLKVPGDAIRLKSGKNYVVVMHNAGWYETEEHSDINHVAHTIHFQDICRHGNKIS